MPSRAREVNIRVLFLGNFRKYKSGYFFPLRYRRPVAVITTFSRPLWRTDFDLALHTVLTGVQFKGFQ